MRLTSLFLFVPAFLVAQNTDGSKFQDEYRLQIGRAKSEIVMDGNLSESTWQAADVAMDFWEKYPQNKEKAKRKTEVRAAYDDQFLYFAATCYDTSHYIVQTLKRDTKFWESDGVSFFLDPQNQRSSGFFFGVSPYNVQYDDLIVPFMEDGLTFTWDNKWRSATQLYPDRWTVEVAIPFKTLRFTEGNKVWGVNFIRNDAKNFQYHTWTLLPLQFEGLDFGYTGALVWDEAPAVQKGNIAVIPYVSGNVAANPEDGEATAGQLNAGVDAKIAVTSSLNLDLTVNPDFSQVEVDAQQTNLTRFDLFFPERRTFFLENDDVFSAYGAPPFRPFFSRSIGLDKDGKAIPILAGARLSGNLPKGFRIGAMNMQTKARGNPGDEDRAAAQNFSAFSVHKRLGSRSAIKGYALNRQSFLSESEQENTPLDEYGRNAGLELNLSDAAGVWNGWGGFHWSKKPALAGNNRFYQVGAGHFGEKLTAIVNWASIGREYYADMGFLNRIEAEVKNGPTNDADDVTVRAGYGEWFNSLEYTMRPSKGKIIGHGPGMENIVQFNADGSMAERFASLGYGISFKNSSEVGVSFEPQQVRLRYYTPLPDDKPLPPGTYTFNQYSIGYLSDTRKQLTFEIQGKIGGFYNGTLWQVAGSATWRVQPWGNFTLGVEQNRLVFPDEYGTSNLLLINPRFEINFSTNLFWTTFLQYNTQQNNFNINSRLQWRYKPMSDLFLVYTDNYFTDPFLKNKNRAIVFKMNYWLNL